jgi:hypothetical protein
MNVYYTGKFQGGANFNPFLGQDNRSSNTINSDFFLSKINSNFLTKIDQINYNQSIKLFPNPTSDYIQMTSNTILPALLSVYSINGVLMQKINTNYSKSVTLDVTNLPPGIYFIKSKNGGIDPINNSFTVFD